MNLKIPMDEKCIQTPNKMLKKISLLCLAAKMCTTVQGQTSLALTYSHRVLLYFCLLEQGALCYQHSFPHRLSRSLWLFNFLSLW